MNIMSIDVEEWFHILNSPATPDTEYWDRLEPRLRANLERLLAFLDGAGTHATFFWLGWAAERYPGLVRQCGDAGHEVGCHGYGHLSYYKVGYKAFREDIAHGRTVLEDVLGRPVTCFRTPGFVVNGYSDWFFETVTETGYTCDSSTLEGGNGSTSCRTHPPGVRVLETSNGPLLEVPVSAMTVLGRRLWSFGGGYMRLIPTVFLDRIAETIARTGKPLVVYVHPRDIDAQSPCLRLGLWGHFKFVVNRKTTFKKLHRLLTRYHFCSIREFLTQHAIPARSEEDERPEVLTREFAIHLASAPRSGKTDAASCRTAAKRAEIEVTVER